MTVILVRIGRFICGVCVLCTAVLNISCRRELLYIVTFTVFVSLFIEVWIFRRYFADDQNNSIIYCFHYSFEVVL